MSIRFLSLAIGLLLAWASAGRSYAEDAAAYEKIVAESTTKYADLFARRDAAGLAALFTTEAEYVDASGIVFHGRSVIETELADQFVVDAPGKLEIEVVSIRPIADGLLVEEGATTFRPNDDGPITQTRYVALHARQADGGWLLAAVRELGPAALSPHERLKTLAWLIGDWREEAAGGVVKTSWRWSDDGVALIADFTMRDAEGATRTGTHRVGWDAERKQFRSWIFDSTGGFVDGWWSPSVDDAWSVRLVGVDAEGARIVGTLNYQRDGAEGLTISQYDRFRGDDALPPVSTRVVRQPPEPGKLEAK